MPWGTLFAKGVTVKFGRTHGRRYTVLLRDLSCPAAPGPARSSHTACRSTPPRRVRPLRPAERLLLIGAAAFGAISILAAYAVSPEMLIAARALLGVAGATLTPSHPVADHEPVPRPRPARQRRRYLGRLLTAGAIIGPLVGGMMLESFWWGSVFLLGVPAMLLLLVAGPVLLPEYRGPAQAGRLDLASVGTFVYRTQLPDSLPTHPPAAAAAAVRDSLAGAAATAQTLPEHLSGTATP